MSSTPIDEARRSLDLAVDALMQITRFKTTATVTSGRSFLEGLLRLVRTIDGNLHLSRSRLECEEDYKRERARLKPLKAAQFAALRRLKDELVAAFPLLEQGLPAHLVDHPFADQYSLSSFDLLLSGYEGRPDSDDDDDDDENGGCAEPAAALQTIVGGLLPQIGIDLNDPKLKEVRRQLSPVRDELLLLRRASLLLKSVHPASAMFWLYETANKCNPRPETPDFILRNLADPPASLKGLRALQFDGRSLDLGWFEQFRTEALGNVITLRSELHTRLGNRASAAWLLQRYAQRCRWFRREEIHRLTGDDAGRLHEVALTRDAALYLFDQGMDVLTEQALGQQRYDILGRSLLVEAKIQIRGRSALMVVADGLRQIHNYHTALDQEGFSLEPILVIFRLSGPHADLPPEAMIGNIIVTIVYIDLGGADESGSRASSPEVVTKDMIAQLLGDAH